MNNQPLEASPPSAIYRLQKFVRRNRAGLAAAATIALVLIGGIVVSGWQAYRATQAEQEMAVEREAAIEAKGKAEQFLKDVDAARKLAERLVTEAGSSAEERIELAFRLLTARRPKPQESQVLRSIYEQQLAVYRADNKAATQLLAVGESRRNSELDAAELAAWTMVVSTILNLDETITKG